VCYLFFLFGIYFFFFFWGGGGGGGGRKRYGLREYEAVFTLISKPYDGFLQNLYERYKI